MSRNNPIVAPTRRNVFALGAGLVAAPALAQAPTQAAADALRIGVLTDETGPYADSAGPGSVLAAEMAKEDFGKQLGDRQIEIVHADTQNRPDVAMAIARRWYDQEKVAAIVDLPVTPVAYAVQGLSAQMNRTVMITASAASEFTTRNAAPMSTHWADDTHALAAGTASAIVKKGPADWFFITVDIAFGAALQRDATEVIEKSGGKVVGSVKHPTNNADFSSLLLQAQASKAKYIGLCSVGGDFVTLMKQAREFGIGRDGKQQLVGFLVYINDIHALGLEAAQNLTISSGFYWAQTESSRAFAQRFHAKRGAMPSKNQALVYQAVTRYLHAVKDAKTDDATRVGIAMREKEFDFFGKPAIIRPDGRVLYDLGVYRVKKPSESCGPWDYYEQIGVVPAREAFWPMGAGPK